ncbi:MAG: hypothetical protein VST71_06695 [Nitrospirota bacterium]|nr:hypothetical protein [Nitrospirota bacterium]
MKGEDLPEDLPAANFSAIYGKEDPDVAAPCHDCDGNRGCCRS